MKARVGVWGKMGTTFAGYLPTIDLQFSEEIGGGGDLSYTALMSDVDALDAWDTVLRVELETSTGWIWGPAYAVRHDYDHPGGSRRFSFRARSLMEVWFSETVVLPEYVVDTVPRKAGQERGVGWMMSAYSPTDDPHEPWDRCYDTSRTTLPPNWPSGTGAKWISASGSSEETESKYFRSWLTITGTQPKMVKFWMASDEEATLWVAGEPIIVDFESGEDKKNRESDKAKMTLYPGTYAIGVDTETVVSKGGDGVDPIIVAGAILNSDGDPATWIVSTNEDDWVACRRDNNPPDDIPPGPTPGAVLHYLITEAKERNASGWDSITMDFNGTHDSYGVPWGTEVLVENKYNYGSETYWSMFQGWIENDDVDIWLTGDLVLHAAPRQGQNKTGSITLTTTHLHSFTTRGQDNRRGSWTLSKYNKGWFYVGTGGMRRESSLEIGTAWSKATTRKITKAAMRDYWRWDGSGSLNPPQTGWMPYQNIKIGDWLNLDYQAIERVVMVTSFSAKAGEGGLLWDIEVTEYQPRVEGAPTTMAAAALETGGTLQAVPEPEVSEPEVSEPEVPEEPENPENSEEVA